MFRSASSTTKILVAPLNWGLGHATRCIPIIKSLLDNQAEVLVACGQSQKFLLQAEFPSLRFINLPGYDLRYGKNRASTLLKIVFQIPKILIEINRENRWLHHFLGQEELDAVISDNRYGLHSSKIVSVLITHQLHIKTPFGGQFEKMVQRLNYRYIDRFSQCWVPDIENHPSLAGELSHPKKRPRAQVRYIGCLSRLEKRDAQIIEGSLLIILSGPEPQRTIFEKLMVSQLQPYTGPVVLIRGLPAERNELPEGMQGKAYNHLPAEQLNRILCSSEFVICRSGYSSIMDIVKLEKKSIVIPTPGQSEQEYLADYLFRERLVLQASQDGFSLNDALGAAKKFAYKKWEHADKFPMQKTITDFILGLRK